MNLPAFTFFSDRDTDFFLFGLKLVSIKSKRIDVSVAAQIASHRHQLTNFINMLHDPRLAATYSVRTIIEPHLSQRASGHVDIALLVRLPVKADHLSSETQIRNFVSNLKLLLGGVFSNYIWAEIKQNEELDRFLNPLDWSSAFSAEVRRREEYIQLDTLVPQAKLGFAGEDPVQTPGDAPQGVYYIHPFSPSVCGFEKLLNTLMQARERIVLTASLSPTSLTPSETDFFHDQIALCEGLKVSKKAFERVQKQRAVGLGHELLRQYLQLQDAPFYVNFCVSSQKPIENLLLEFVGLAITEPVGNSMRPDYDLNVGGYDIAIPLSERDAQIARSNMRDLTQRPWLNTQTLEDRRRLRYLFDGFEALSAFYLPINAENDIVGLDTFTMDELPLPRELVELSAAENANILLGKNHFFGFEQDVVIPEDTRRQHTYIIGQTGTGKTTLMKTMILSDMKAGNGLAVIDPHGELYRELLEMIPEERKEDVVLFDPSDVEFPIGFNLLEVKEDEEKEYIVKEMRAILNRFLTEYFHINDGDIIGPIFFTHVQNNMLLAATDPDNPGTLIEFYNIFEKRDYWKRWLPLRNNNRWLKNWVENVLPNTDYNKVGSNGLRLGDYYSSKFIDFVNDPQINLIFGQPYSTIDLDEVVRDNKILLVNLSKGLLGEANASLLGMMLMAKLNTVFMHRMKGVSKLKELKPFYLYVDEFQNIATENFSILLAEARKFGLGLILANQYLQQISDHKILNAIIGNVGTMISFRLGVEDAEMMASQFKPYYDAQAISELPNYQAVFRTNVKGERTLPCNFKTVLHPSAEVFASSREVVDLSRGKYAIPKNLADFLVVSSQADIRISKSELYFEKSRTPKKYRIVNIIGSELILDFYKDFKAAARHRGQLIESLMRQIFFFLTYEKDLPKESISSLLDQLEKREDFLIDEMPEVLQSVFKPVLGQTTEQVRGVYNAVFRKFLLDKYNEIESSDPEAQSIIMDFMNKDHWYDAAYAIAHYWRAPKRDRLLQELSDP